MNRHNQNTLHVEDAVIGSLLSDQGAYDEVSYLQPEDFGSPIHRDAYRAIRSLINAGKSADIISVSQYLAPKDNTLYCELCEIVTNNSFKVCNVKHYADLVKQESIDRKMVAAAQEIITTVRDKKEHRLDYAQQKIAEITDSLPFNMVIAEDVLGTVMQRVDERQSNPSALVGLSTGFIGLDKITHGLHGGHLVVLAARPSMGKTLLAMNIAEHVAINEKKTVAMFSLEMNKEELMERSLSSLGRIESDLMKSGRLTAEDFGKVTSILPKYNGAKLFIDDCSSLSVSDIRSRCRRIKREHGLSLVIVDYIGLVSGEGENETDRVGKISRALKILARDLNVPVLAISQLNRGVENQQDKRPTMAHLRQSGAIEQDADLILFIYRDEVYNKGSSNKGIAEINIAKNRHGGLGTVYLAFNNKHCRFDNYSGFPMLQAEKPAKEKHYYDRGASYG